MKDKPDSPGAEPAFWWPILQLPFPNSDMSVVMRANSDPQLLGDALRNQVRQLDPSLAVANVKLLDQITDESIATPRFAFFLVGLFAGLAIVLAAIGTYGVISYSVSQRIPEFGLRLTLVLRRMTSCGWFSARRLASDRWRALGLVIALALARVLRSLVYNVSPIDPVTFISVMMMVIAIALFACYLPARRAAKASPMIALRTE